MCSGTCILCYSEGLVFMRCVMVGWTAVNAGIFKCLFSKAIKYADLRDRDVRDLKMQLRYVLGLEKHETQSSIPVKIFLFLP